MNLVKPSFPPGWTLPDGIKILKQIEKQQFVEVFSLDSGEYLYLFHEFQKLLLFGELLRYA